MVYFEIGNININEDWYSCHFVVVFMSLMCDVTTVLPPTGLVGTDEISRYSTQKTRIFTIEAAVPERLSMLFFECSSFTSHKDYG